MAFILFRFMWRKHPQFHETHITLISSLWPDAVPPNLDAAYQNVWENANLFFKGRNKRRNMSVVSEHVWLRIW